MKLYEKSIGFGRSLRRGLLAVVCFLCIAGLLAGCGAEDNLLSELRREGESAKEQSENDDGADESAGQGEGAGKDGSAGEPVTGGKDAQDIRPDAGNAKDPQSAGQGDGNAEDMAETGRIYVHVCGAVASPGVYEMPEGSRFYEAVDAAGGFAENACQDYLNMAAPLADGSRLEIPTVNQIQERKTAEDKSGKAGENSRDTEYSYYTTPETPASAAGSAGTSGEGLVNINTADIAGLCALPGIGEGRAKAIIEYREKQGGFQKKEDIMQVSGIGEKMYARMEAYLTVE